MNSHEKSDHPKVITGNFIGTAIIVDDMLSIRQTLGRILENINIPVLAQASRANHAIALFEQLRPSLVCLDIGLPDGSGLDVLAKIKMIAPGTKVVMISGDSERKIVLAAKRAGADEFIVKPFSPLVIQQIIYNLINK